MNKCQICKQQYKEEPAWVKNKKVCQFCYEKHRKPTNGGRSEDRRVADYYKKWVENSEKNKKNL